MENTEKTASVPESSWDSFLKTWGTNEWSNIYGDFFQETSDGSISIGPRAQKSWLEVMTTILGYIVPIAVFFTAIGSAHVFLRTQEKSWFAENYSFLCPYLSYGVNDEESQKDSCKTITMIGLDYEKRSKDLQVEIIKYLTEYIPIKVSQNIMDVSPERTFIINTYENKIYVDDIMNKFEDEKRKAQYSGGNNVECNGITISDRTLLSTQCTIYGWDIGDDDSNGKLWSARIMALRFLETIWTTSNSQFIFLNPPTSLSIEKITGGAWGEDINPIFKTRTTVQLQLQYVPLNQKL